MLLVDVPADIVITSRSSGQVLITARGVIAPSAGPWLRGRLDLIVDDSPRPFHMVVDLAAVTGCDVRVLAVLHALHLRMVAAHGRLVVRGLDPAVLTGFAGATVVELLAAYQASRALAQPQWPKEPGWRNAASRFTDSERRLIAFGAELAALGPATSPAATDRLAAWCGRVFAMRTAVVMLIGDPASRGMAVVAASDERARLAAVAGLGVEEGPVAECLLREEPVGSADLEHDGQRWPRYVHAAQRHEVRAVRALPLRIPRPVPAGRSATVGALILMTHRPGPMAPADLQVALALADLVGVTLAGDAGWARGVPAQDARAPSDRSRRDLVMIEQAVGLMAERERLGPAAARTRLIEHARSRDLHLTEYARMIVNTPTEPGCPATADLILLRDGRSNLPSGGYPPDLMNRRAEVPRGQDAVPTWVAERLQEIRSRLDVSGPATGATAARARRTFATWLAVDLAAGDCFDDLVLVVYEAVANAVDHAYRRSVVGPVRLLARRTRRAVHVTVADHGTWREASSGRRTAGPGDVNVRGRGLALIRRLVPDVHIELSATGTTVHLRAPVPAPS